MDVVSCKRSTQTHVIVYNEVAEYIRICIAFDVIIGWV